MKIYRIKLSNREEIIIPENKLLLVLASKEQLVKITFEDGKDWEMVNKAHIVNAKIDYEETRRASPQPKLLSEKPMTEEERKKQMQKLAEIKASFSINKK